MKRTIWKVMPTEDDPIGAVVERIEDATPTHEDQCLMCGACLACQGEEEGFMVCQGSGGSMNSHSWDAREVNGLAVSYRPGEWP